EARETMDLQVVPAPLVALRHLHSGLAQEPREPIQPLLAPVPTGPETALRALRPCRAGPCAPVALEASECARPRLQEVQPRDAKRALPALHAAQVIVRAHPEAGIEAAERRREQPQEEERRRDLPQRHPPSKETCGAGCQRKVR